jgi:hypothetical protein
MFVVWLALLVSLHVWNFCKTSKYGPLRPPVQFTQYPPQVPLHDHLQNVTICQSASFFRKDRARSVNLNVTETCERRSISISPNQTMGIKCGVHRTTTTTTNNNHQTMGVKWGVHRTTTTTSTTTTTTTTNNNNNNQPWGKVGGTLYYYYY